MIALIASAALGATIGLIRQWDQQAEDQSGEFAGVRTFTFWSVLGCLAAFVSDEYSAAVLPVVLVAVAVHTILGQRAGRTGPVRRERDIHPAAERAAPPYPAHRRAGGEPRLTAW